MPVTKDDVTYDQLHERLLRDMLLAIKDELDAHELDHDEVHDLTANIALAISALLDGTSPMSLNGKRLVPLLAFSEEGQPEQLIVNGRGSYLHEIVDSLFDQMDESEEEEDDDEDEEEDDFDYEEDDEDDSEDDDDGDEEDDDPRRH